MNTFQIVCNGEIESTLQTIQAANNRLRMLRKHNPGMVYTLDKRPLPCAISNRVTVAPVPADGHYINLVRA